MSVSQPSIITTTVDESIERPAYAAARFIRVGKVTRATKGGGSKFMDLIDTKHNGS